MNFHFTKYSTVPGCCSTQSIVKKANILLTLLFFPFLSFFFFLKDVEQQLMMEKRMRSKTDKFYLKLMDAQQTKGEENYWKNGPVFL